MSRRGIVLDLNLVVTIALRVGLLSMIVKASKEIARDWVTKNARAIPGFQGAFFHGSITWLPDDANLSPTSDLDVVVVVDESQIMDKPGKLVFRNVLLDVSFLAATDLESPETLLSNSHLAGSFRAPSVISDPSGWLTDLNIAVARDFAQRQWVIRRCEHANGKVLQNLASLDQTKPLHDQVVSWLFATGVTTHILLTAGLRNPTVRQRYLAVRRILHDYQRLSFYDDLLGLMGCANISRERVELHLEALTSAFDSAKSVVKTPFLFAADISDLGRPIAIDGSRELVARGDHREAVFWMVATYSRCQQIFYADAPAKTRNTFNPGYMALLADLGITSHADLARRCDEVRTFLPLVWEEAEVIMRANPEIED
jgi:hypothetical protein